MKNLLLWLTILGTCGCYACAFAFIEVPWSSSARTTEQRISIQLLPTAPSISAGAPVEEIPEESASRQPEERTLEPEATPEPVTETVTEPTDIRNPDVRQTQTPLEQEMQPEPELKESEPEPVQEQSTEEQPPQSTLLPDLRTFQTEFLERLKERVSEAAPLDAPIVLRSSEEPDSQKTAKDPYPTEAPPEPTTAVPETIATARKTTATVEFLEYPSPAPREQAETIQVSQTREVVEQTKPADSSVPPRETPHIEWAREPETPQEKTPLEKPEELRISTPPAQAPVAPRQETMAATTVEQPQTTVTQYIDVESATVAPQFPLEQLRRRIVYPTTARRLGKEGAVLLELWISAEGTIDRIEVLEDPGYGMAQAAINAFKNLTGKPGSLDGNDVAVRMRYPIRFSLQQ